jgi:hypothetical protein
MACVKEKRWGSAVTEVLGIGDWGVIGSDGSELAPVRYAAIELVTADLIVAREHGKRILLRPDHNGALRRRCS